MAKHATADAPAESHSDRRLRLLSYNIQSGSSTQKYRHYVTKSWQQVLPNSERVDNLHQIANLLSDFDLVALQESDAGSLRSGFINQTQYLADLARFPHWNTQINRRVGKIAHASIGLLSRIEPQHIVHHKLPGPIPGRGAMLIQFGNQPCLTVVIVHLALGKRARLKQIRYLCEQLKDSKHLIMMGDFNSCLGSNELNYLFAELELIQPEHGLHTFPSWQPERSLDHIFVSPELTVNSIKVIDIQTSDHLPISVDLTLPKSLVI